MTAWVTLIGAIFQVVLLLIQSYNTKKSEVSQAHADKAKDIADAISSKNVSAINAVVNSVRQ